MKPIIYVADSHLTRDDPEVDSFIQFLLKVGPTASTLFILGDLFNVWFGEPKFRMPHQQRVLDALAQVRAQGITLKFVEGNRDFSVKRNYTDAPFSEVSETRLVEHFDGRRILAEHGDEVNQEDRQYRLWKRASKSFLVYGIFRLLPGPWGVAAGESLERRLSGTNIRHKTAFPMQQCRAYAERLFASTCDAIVLGHFHVEQELRFTGGTVYVLPTWRGHHRYLIVEEKAAPRFADFTG